MKIIVSLILTFYIFLSGPLEAQSFVQKARLDKHSIVKDPGGRIYLSQEWMDSVNAGTHVIRPMDPANEKTIFVLLNKAEDQQWQLDHSPMPPASTFFKTGNFIADFIATDIKGDTVRLKSLKGKVVVLNFWFIACMPCQQEIPELNKLVHEFKDSTDLIFLSICLDEKSRILKFLERIPFDYAIIDNGRTITGNYGITNYPTHVVMDKDGKVVFHTSGYRPSTINWLKKTITGVLK